MQLQTQYQTDTWSFLIQGFIVYSHKTNYVAETAEACGFGAPQIELEYFIMKI